MLKFKYSKLVRDKIVEHQIASGAVPKYRQLDDEQHKSALVNKIIEEAQEIISSDARERASEIADVQQALDDLREMYGLTTTDVAKVQKARLAKNGAFKKGIFIDYVKLDKDDEWVEYYRSSADRYPEIE